MNTPKQIPAAPRPYLRVATPLMAAALGALSACGGGGGSSPAPSPAPTPAAVDCVAKVETVGACQFSIPAIKSGLSLLVATSSMGYKGSVTATCGTTGVLDVKTSSTAPRTDLPSHCRPACRRRPMFPAAQLQRPSKC